MAVVTDGLRFYLDGRDGVDTQTTWTDRSPNALMGTLSGFDFNASSGWTGTALRFDNVNDSVTFPNNSAISIGGEITLEAYIRIDPNINSSDMIIQKGYSLGYELSISRVWSPTSTTRIGFATSNAQMTCDINLMDNQFHHIVCRRLADGTKHIFVDVVLIATGTGALNAGTNNLIIGSAGASAFFCGDIGVIRIYNRALSNAEILQNYFDVKGYTCVANGLQLYLDGKDGSGSQTTWADRSANGNNGTLTNFQFDADDGWTGTSLKFDGSNDFVDCGNGASLNITGEITLEVYFRISPSIPDVYWIVEKAYYLGYGIAVFRHWELNSTGINFDTDGTAITSVTNIRDNQFHHIVGRRYADGTKHLFIDNVLRATGSGSLSSYTQPLGIGMAGAYGYLLGEIGVVRIYNRALSDAEISNNYTSATGLSVIVRPDIDITNVTRTKISDETGMDVCSVTFRSDQDLTQWEARADGNGVGVGLLVGSGGAVTANTDVQFTVENEELTNGDRTYRINVYGRNSEGEWSVYE